MVLSFLLSPAYIVVFLWREFDIGRECNLSDLYPLVFHGRWETEDPRLAEA